MTTQEQSQANTSTASPKEKVKQAAIATVICGVLLGAAIFALNFYIDESVEYRTQQMLSSLETHGVTVDHDTANKVSEACTRSRFSSTAPISTTIIQEREGKKNTVTITCDSNTKASEVAITPAS